VSAVLRRVAGRVGSKVRFDSRECVVKPASTSAADSLEQHGRQSHELAESAGAFLAIQGKCEMERQFQVFN
jgi:hypothetical protein